MTERPVDAVRKPAVAGRFYPADPRALAAAVDEMLGAAADPPPGVAPPAGIVVPHAGYRYSGPVAASAYARLAPLADRVRTVVVLGPAHYEPVATVAVPTAAAFRTPLGRVPVDEAGRARILAGGVGVASDRAHGPEHSLEVQLPFLQRALRNGWRVLPVVVGGDGEAAAADLLALVADEATLVVCSTDLSHYLPYDRARARDRLTARAVLARDAGAIGARDACGAAALRGFLRWSTSIGLRIELLDLRTSGDTAGDRARVVGYGAFAAAP